MVFRLVGGQMRRYANPIDEINATFAEENREALAGMRQWILNISKSGDSEEVKSKST